MAHSVDESTAFLQSTDLIQSSCRDADSEDGHRTKYGRQAATRLVTHELSNARLCMILGTVWVSSMMWLDAASDTIAMKWYLLL